MKQFKFSILGILICLFALHSSSAEARRKEVKVNEDAIKWEMHKSITNVFDVKFSQEYKYKIFPFQFNNDTVAYAEEIYASLYDGTPKTKDKSIMVKVSQTFGSPLTYKDAKAVLDNSVKRYLVSSKDLKTKVLTNKDTEYEGFMGKDIYLSYMNKGKKFGLRIKIYVTNYAKIEQVLSGPAGSMYSYVSDDFFDSISLYDGIFKKVNPIGVGWVEYPSKNNIFTAVLPPMNSSYTPNLPKFKATPQSESMNFSIHDPVLERSVKYNVYSYKGVSNFSYEKVKSMLFASHVSKFVKNADLDSLKTENKTHDKYKSMKTKLVITPTKKHPNINTIYLEAQYRGDTLIVQEFLCGTKHANSGLNNTLFSQLKFHPQKYKYIKENKVNSNKKEEKN